MIWDPLFPAASTALTLRTKFPDFAWLLRIIESPSNLAPSGNP